MSDWKDILKGCGCGCNSCGDEDVEKAGNKKPQIERVKGGVKYRGEKFPGVNKPKRAPKGSKKKYRVLAHQDGKYRVVEFGARGYKDFLQHKDSKRRANFKSRHNCDEKKDKTKAGYWACNYNW